MRRTAAFTIALLVLVLASLPHAQGTSPATPLTLVSREGRRPVPTVVLSSQEFIALDDVAALFQVAVREDTLAGGITLTYKGKTVIASPDQPMASVGGRVVSLPSPAVRAGRRWLVPLEFLPRALGPIYDARIDLRRAERLLVVGDLRVPRVAARIEATAAMTRVTLDIAPATSVTTVVENGRVVVRFDVDALDLALPAAGMGLIEQVRPGDQANTIAVVLAPRAGMPRAVSTSSDNATHVTIEVPPTALVEAAAPPPPAPALPPESRPTLPAVRSGLQTIVLDPGHGGADTGAHGRGGAVEKEITLEVAKRLKAQIENSLGVRVIMTRDDDRAVSLDERAAIANNGKADLFLSLHLNAAPTPAVAGAEVYHLRLDREGEAARRSAEPVTVALQGGGSRAIEVILWDLAQAAHVEASSVLASMLQEELRKHVPMGVRAVQSAPMRVLTGVNMPAALIEMAYLTNADQEQRAKSADFQASLVDACYDAVVRFRDYLNEGHPQ